MGRARIVDIFLRSPGRLPLSEGMRASTWTRAQRPQGYRDANALLSAFASAVDLDKCFLVSRPLKDDATDDVASACQAKQGHRVNMYPDVSLPRRPLGCGAEVAAVG